MSDDTKSADAQKPSDEVQKPVDTASEQEAKPWRNEAEVKKIIAERDKAESTLREIREKEKKLAEEKAISEGKTKEILAQKEAELADARKKAELYEQEQKAIREAQLAQITDAEAREIAQELSTPKLMAFVKKFNSERGSPYSGKQQPIDKDTNPWKRKPGESLMDWSNRVDAQMGQRK